MKKNNILVYLSKLRSNFDNLIFIGLESGFISMQ